MLEFRWIPPLVQAEKAENEADQPVAVERARHQPAVVGDRQQQMPGHHIQLGARPDDRAQRLDGGHVIGRVQRPQLPASGGLTGRGERVLRLRRAHSCLSHPDLSASGS